jgi:hypothetical protein
MSSISQKKPIGFLNLPGEVRNIVYEYAAEAKNTKVMVRGETMKKPAKVLFPYSDLSMSCKIVRAEYLWFWYRNIIVEFKLLDKVLDPERQFLRKVPLNAWTGIRNRPKQTIEIAIQTRALLAHTKIDIWWLIHQQWTYNNRFKQTKRNNVSDLVQALGSLGSDMVLVDIIERIHISTGSGDKHPKKAPSTNFSCDIELAPKGETLAWQVYLYVAPIYLQEAGLQSGCLAPNDWLGFGEDEEHENVRFFLIEETYEPRAMSKEKYFLDYFPKKKNRRNKKEHEGWQGHHCIDKSNAKRRLNYS